MLNIGMVVFVIVELVLVSGCSRWSPVGGRALERIFGNIKKNMDRCS